jgi:hypothetical protein
MCGFAFAKQFWIALRVKVLLPDFDNEVVLPMQSLCQDRETNIGEKRKSPITR